MNRHLRLAARTALVAGCLLYVFWDLDWPALGRALARFNLTGVVLMVIMMWVCLVFGGFRLKHLSRGGIGFADGFNSLLLGLGLSNILPAKSGELVKALYIRREADMPFSSSLSMIFWERFFDLNAVFVLGLMAAIFMDKAPIAVSLGLLTLSVWLVLAAVRKWPSAAPKLARLLIFEKLKVFFIETVNQAAEGLRIGYLAGAALITLPLWFTYYLEYHFLLFSAAELDLSLADGLSIFVVSALGMAAPSSPGAIGVYEAVIVAALGLYGVEKERALAVGLVYRFFQYVPITLYALALMARKGLPLKRARSELAEAGRGAGDESGARNSK